MRRVRPGVRWAVLRRGMVVVLACAAACVPGCLAVLGTGIELVLGAGALSNAALLPFAGGALAWLAGALL
jgi:hypothetical protein